MSDMFPGMEDGDIGEIVAEFFNKILREYMPISNSSRYSGPFNTFVQEWEVSARLKSFKKPKSQVAGDIHPDIVTKMHDDLLAIHLSFVFNQTLSMLE